MDTKNQELEYKDQPNATKSVLTGLLFGGILGAGAMLFFAPQSGAKTRAEVQQGALQLRDRTSEAVKGKFDQVKTRTNQIKTDVKSRAEDIEHKGKVLIARQLDNVSHAAKAGRKAIQSS
jgi:gas vesicle protein